MPQEVSHFFKWPSGILSDIRAESLPGSLRKQLGAYAVSEKSGSADIRIVYARGLNNFSPAAVKIRGRYKGLPWTLGVEDAEEPVYYFHAPLYPAFLFIRVCLLPLLKKKILEKGGVLMIGSAFRAAGRTFILFGRPGAGKTRLLFEALRQGAAFAGDSELEITADKDVLSVFPFVELRFKTIAGTCFWPRLRLLQKTFLAGCQAVSALTLGKISFNLLIAPADLKIAVSSGEKAGNLTFVFLDPESRIPEAVTEASFLEAVGDYEREYQRAYGRNVFTPELLDRSLKQTGNLLKTCSLWRVPHSISIQELLKLNQA